MVAYIVLILLLFVGDKLIADKKGKAIYMTILFVAFMGLRNPLTNGSDTIGYYNLFNDMKTTDWNNIFDGRRIEHGFLIYVKICSMFIKNPQWFFMLSAVVMFVPLGLMVYKYSESVLQSFLLFIYFSFFSFFTSGFRQSLAIGICMLGLLCIEKRKPIRFIILILLAITFHKSAIIFLPAYWISKAKNSNLNLVIYGGGCVLALIFMPTLATWFNDYGDYEYVVQNTTGGIPTFICILLATVIMISESRNFIQRKSLNLIFYNLQLITTVLWIARFSNIMAERLSLYYFIFIIITLPNLYKSLTEQFNKNLCYIVMLIVPLLFFYKQVGGFSLTPLPYDFFWQ